jgi:hypothetical protein
MRFQVGRFTCEMGLDASGEVKVEWQPRRPLYLNPAERRQYQASRKAFLESLEDHPSALREAQNAQDQRPRLKAHGKDSTTKTSIIFTVAVAALASGLISGATAA